MLCLAAAGACSRHANPTDLFNSATRLFRQGEYPAAQKPAALGYSEFQNQPGSEWFWKFRLLLADIDLYNGDTSEASLLLSKAPPAKYRESFIQYRILQSYALYRAKKVWEADSELEAAAAQAHSIGAWELEADAQILLGSRLLPPTNWDREAALRKARQIATEQHLSYQQTQAVLDLGMTRFRRDFYGDAIPYFEQAAALAGRMHFKGSRRMAEQNEADCYREMGDVDRALKIQLDVVAAEEKTGASTTLSVAYIDLGASYLVKQDAARAVECFRKALLSVKASQMPAQFVFSASNLAQALEATGALDEAQRYDDMGREACYKGDPEELAELALTGAAIAEDRGKHEQAMAGYRKVIEASRSDTPSVLWEAHAGLGSVYARLGDIADARAHFEQALRVIEQNRADQLKREYEVMFLSNLIRFYQEYVTVLMSQGEVEGAIEVADSSRAAVLTQNVAGTDRVRSGRLVQQVQREAKLTNSVFLFYWLAPAQSYLWVLTADALKTIPLPDERGIAQDVASYLSLLVDEKRDPLASSNTVGKRLYQALIAPAEPWLPRGAHVVIVPDGALHNLNFEMLLADKPEPHYWIEDVVISVAPSLSILGSNKARAGLQPSLLLMGDADPAPGYPKLPQSALELEDVEHHFAAAGTTVYRGAAATVDRYRDAGPNKFSSIHFAAHAEADGQSPLDSAIILSPQANGYKLYARDVMNIPLTADLVTISACRGAGVRAFSGEGLVGFAWAFFQAGARNVVTSLWDVNDRTTAELMDRFYGRLQAGERYANALRDAKLAMLESGNRKPYFWAPFQLYTRVAARN